MIYIEILLIAVIVCFVIDCSGFVDSLKNFIGKKIFHLKNFRPSDIMLKPFDCSLCMTFWTTLLYTIVTGNIHLYTICYICVISLLTRNISNMLFWLQDTISTIQNLFDKINK